MKKNVLLLILLVMLFGLVSINVYADEAYETLKNGSGATVCYYGTNNPIKIPTTYTERTEEFRGTWVSFYAGDVSKYTTDQQMKAQLLAVLENLEYYNMNAIVFHIRTHNDAMYDTDLAPQSSYVSGMNYDEFDYLEWFIAECHKRGIEFHAWLNPYRIYSSGGTLELIKEKYKDYPKNPAHDINNVLINKDGAAILDPGRPEVRKYVVDTCIEVMEKYDVDAIHFDDYFYINDIDDSATRTKYNTKKLSIDDFRRNQVDTFVNELSDAMFSFNTEHNRSVQLGISPTAMYRNYGSYVDPNNYKYDSEGTLTYPYGSGTNGWQHYGSSLYCDSKKWIDNEWIDYIVPQTYFSIDYSIASHAALSDWWAGVCKNKKVNCYLGIGLYRTDSSTAGWKNNADELLYQLRYDNINKDVDGVCIYQYKYLKAYKNREVMNKLVKSYWTTTPKTPVIERYASYFDGSDKVENLQVHKGDGVVTLTWNKIDSYDKYAIYKYSSSLDINNVSQVLGFAGEIENGICGFTDNNPSSEVVNYAVVPISRASTYASSSSIKSNQYTDINVSLGDIDFSVGKAAIVNGSVVVIINSIIENLGDKAKYTVYASYNSDMSDSFVLIEEQVYSGSQVLRYNFNSKGKPTYIQVKCVNSAGVMMSDIKCSYLDDDALTISKYAYSYIKDFFNDLLGD